MSKIRFGIVGIGGYAQIYHQAVAHLVGAGAAELVAVAEWQQENFPAEINRLKQAGVRIFKDYADLLRECAHDLDFVGLPVGIHLHAPMTIAALRAGLNVICEKPVAATVQDVEAMIAERDRAQKRVLIGYQEIYSASIQQIKKYVVTGKLGKVNRVKVKGGWPRGSSYYTRNAWAGKIRLKDTWVLDGPANNAMAHYINNMLYVACPEPNASAVPKKVWAELYRANAIETYDTIALKVALESGADLFFLASHCSETEFHPEMTVNCENGTVVRQFINGATKITWADGSVEEFDDAGENAREEVFRTAVSLLRGQAKPYCSLEIARAQTQCINGMHESCPEILQLPKSQIQIKSSENDTTLIIPGIDAIIEHAYAEDKLFAEMGVSWARPAVEFKLENYREFPQPAKYK
jgi:predicted dehydrogenase